MIWAASDHQCTAPTARSEASVTIQVGASDFGCTRRVALARVSLTIAKAARASSVHCSSLVPLVASRLLSGCRM